MINYRGNYINKDEYIYSLNNFKIDFNLNFDFREFLNLSKVNQKNFFYNNMEFAIKKHIRNSIIKIPNYENNEELKPLIIYLHCLNMQNIKLLKDSKCRVFNYIQLKIPVFKDINTDWYFNLEIDLLKKMEKESKNENIN